MELLVTRKNNSTRVVFIDDEDFVFLADYTLSIASREGVEYVICSKQSTQTLLHRLLLNITNPLILVDHRNNNGLDCRKHNLRQATKSENGQNRQGLQSNNTSGVQGVSWHAGSGKWHARVKLNQKVHSLGYHAELSIAASAVTSFKAKHMPFSKEFEHATNSL